MLHLDFLSFARFAICILYILITYILETAECWRAWLMNCII